MPDSWSRARSRRRDERSAKAGCPDTAAAVASSTRMLLSETSSPRRKAASKTEPKREVDILSWTQPLPEAMPYPPTLMRNSGPYSGEASMEAL